VTDHIVIGDAGRAVFPGRPASLDEFLAAAPALVRRQRRTRIYRGPGIFLKLYLFPGIDRLETLVRPCTAQREYENLVRFAAAGVRVPAPFGYAIRRRFGLVQAGAIAEEAIEDAIDLRAWALAARERSGPTADRERGTVIRELGAAMGRLHAAGLVYGRGGAHLRNIMLRRRDGERPDLLFTDTPDARLLRGRALRRGRERDLGRLLVHLVGDLGPGARQTFFEAYHAPDAGAADREALERGAEHHRRRYHDETFYTNLKHAFRRRFRHALGYSSAGGR
jgi:hypothetical protein